MNPVCGNCGRINKTYVSRFEADGTEFGNSEKLPKYNNSRARIFLHKKAKQALLVIWPIVIWSKVIQPTLSIGQLLSAELSVNSSSATSPYNDKCLLFFHIFGHVKAVTVGVALRSTIFLDGFKSQLHPEMDLIWDATQKGVKRKSLGKEKKVKKLAQYPEGFEPTTSQFSDQPAGALTAM